LFLEANAPERLAFEQSVVQYYVSPDRDEADVGLATNAADSLPGAFARKSNLFCFSDCLNAA